jgi:predicted nucleic acid-binding protein
MALIHLDAGVIIGFLDGSDAHHTAARSALAAAQQRGDRLAMASAAFAECLVGPSRRGEAAVKTVRDLFDRLPISIVPLHADTAVVAAQLRARHPALRLPDAIVIATAIDDEADELVTTDRGWPSAKALKLKATLRHL